MPPVTRRTVLSSGLVTGMTAALNPSSVSSSQTASRDARPQARPIRIGQIGVGHAHATKLTVYRESPDYEVVGIAEPDEQLRNAAKVQAAYRDLNWMSVEQLLNTPGLQAVLVETRVRDLLATAARCVAAGMHVHLDKPAGQSLPKFQQLLQSAEKQNLLVQLGYMYRYNPAFLKLKEFLQRGWLGDVFEVHCVMSKVVAAAARRALGQYPGGILFELGCHILDLTIDVLGEPASVHGHRTRVVEADDKLIDNMLAVLTYPRAIATVKSSAVEVDGFARRHFAVCGTRGTCHIQPLDNPSLKVAFAEKHGEYRRGYQTLNFPRYTRYVGDAADMARIIRGETAAQYTPTHDLIVQRTLLQACGLPLD